MFEFRQNGTYRNRETGCVIVIEELFHSGGELIANSKIVAGPHSVGCTFQHRPRHADLEEVSL